MQLEIGNIYDGKVTEITKFGAFVEVSGKTGMVHISEISNTYVNEIKDHVSVGQEVKVKVIGITEEGKISLSIKKAMPAPERPKRNFGDKNTKSFDKNKSFKRNIPQPRDASMPPPEFDSVGSQPKDNSFEDMLNRFKQTSEEKFSDLKRIQDNKRRTGARRK
ncbi:MAG: S1 RNA-binding domain-containing protein [Ruminococcus sp.]|nr:S1 RNA-binding domain-containing protein [Ruminococcus sp.]